MIKARRMLNGCLAQIDKARIDKTAGRLAEVTFPFSNAV